MNALFAISVIVIYAAKAILRAVVASRAGSQGRRSVSYPLCRPTTQLCWEIAS